MTNDNILFRNELQGSERILWTGRPHPTTLWNWIDLVAIGVGVLILGFTLWTNAQKFLAGDLSSWFGFTFFVLVGLCFLGLGLLPLFRSHTPTVYALTTERILALRG